jgi:acetyl-CoA acetyltransferase family protein
VPIGSNRQGADFHGPSVTARYAPGLVPQGVSAELIAREWGLSRERLDAFSVRSHQRAAAAAQDGAFDREIVPIQNGAGPVTADETIRPGATVEAIAGLRPSFASADMVGRFPDLDWRITAASSSQLTDGASALLLVSERKARELGLRPRARLVAFHACGDDPLMMLTGPIPATREVLAKAGLSMHDIDHFEVNEAFASVPLAWRDTLGVDEAKLNPRGGAIALGHPLGATGCRLLTTMLHALEDNDQRYGLQAVCEAGGMANALIVERL